MSPADDVRRGAIEHIRSSTKLRPQAAIILGSGLGGLADRIEEPVRFAFSSIPGFQSVTAGGHRGQLILGRLSGRPVVAMAGRFHRYEGWSDAEVTFPVELMAALGAGLMIVSNAAGGVSPKLRVGDLVLIGDHVNWMHASPGNPPSDGASRAASAGVRADGMDGSRLDVPRRQGGTYDRELIDIARAAALEHGFMVTEGCYLATLGPNYETRAEYRMMRRLGVDVVGMSTVPEVLAARGRGMRVLGISMVSNVATPDRPLAAEHGEVLAAGARATGRMEAIVRSVLVSAAADDADSARPRCGGPSDPDRDRRGSGFGIRKM